jgi:endonuclease/exonuclease/phosphatase (EEP) superfamily protein YafD
MLGALVFSLAGYLGRWHKYAELASHFKTQYLLASVVCLLFFLFYRERAWGAAAAFGVAINLAAIAPWYLGGKNLGGKRIAGRRVKLLLANVNFENTAHETLIAFVQRHAPDVLVVQEVDSVWCNSLQPLQSMYPFFEALPKGAGSGMALYSRFQFERLNVVLAEGDTRPGILAKMNIDGASVSLLSVHPRAPIRKGHFELRNEMLVSAADCLRNLSGPKICIGDLNITPWSPYYRRFAEQTKLANVRKGFGLLPSWPTFLFFKWLMIPLDHCLVSDGICVIDVKTGEPIGSDHLPLLVELEIQSK